MNQPSRLKVVFRGFLVVEIAEHEARATATDLANLARFKLLSGSSRVEYRDLIARAGFARSFDDQLRIIVRQRILVGAGLGHAVAALRDMPNLSNSAITAAAARTAPEMRKPCTSAHYPKDHGLSPPQEVDSMGGHADEEGSTRFDQAINEASAARQIMDDELPTDS